jgi:ferredoxin, 2Fe-2S
MPIVLFLPLNVKLTALKGKCILDLAFENDLVIEHNCGGLCACTSCKVLIEKGMHLLKEKSENEFYVLSKEGFEDVNYRLSCQCIIEKDSNEEIVVRIPQ